VQPSIYIALSSVGEWRIPRDKSPQAAYNYIVQGLVEIRLKKLKTQNECTRGRRKDRKREGDKGTVTLVKSTLDFRSS